jgi:hypothetical protein
MNIWEKRFKWLAIQHWVEDDAGENLDIEYSCHDSYIDSVVKAVDAEIAEEEKPAHGL